MTNISTAATKTITSAINLPNHYYKFRNIHNILTQISFPYIFIIVCLGLITNTLTIVLLSKGFVTKNLKHKWTLIALALGDLVHNIALLIRIIHDIIYGKIEYICIAISFLSHLAELLSACFTVLFTVQRYAAVRYPLQAAFSARSSPITSLLSVFICSIAFCIALSYFNLYIDCHEELKLTWFCADALLSFIIPFSLILIFNILIVNLIRKHARSPFTVQPMSLQANRPVKNDMRYKFRRNNRSKESFSITGSYGVTRTSHGTLIETDIDRRLSSNISLMKNNKSNTSSIRMTSRSPCGISNETEFLASEQSLPMLPPERVNSDCLPNTHPISTSPQTNKPEQDVQRKGQHRSSNINPSRRVSHLSNDLDFVSNKSSQTTQSIRVTRMLVLVSTCFLILNAPAHLCVIALKIYTGFDLQVYNEHAELDQFRQRKNLTSTQMKNFVFVQEKSNKMVENKLVSDYDMDIIDDPITIHLFYIVTLITQLISYASYSINFFLYSFSGVAFRTSLRQIFNKLR
ncbi:unnamed protein product [Rotaria magnacalcarata]|nr:unnamed protein product [Rotaria magnacalcarata]CAF2066502.1 unnamed protein product [Rotaria magnacalcarata]CAF2067484.1 unnamed protein product [Rotaria magnacalcarata]